MQIQSICLIKVVFHGILTNMFSDDVIGAQTKSTFISCIATVTARNTNCLLS